MKASELTPGDLLERGGTWWTVLEVTQKPQRVGGASTSLELLDHRSERRQLTLPADMPVRARRPAADPTPGGPT